MQPSVEILPFDAQRESFEELTRLVNGAYRQLGDMGLNYVAVDQGAEVTRARVESASACWVARRGGKLAGTICYYATSRDRSSPAWYRREEVCHFGQFAVDPPEQRSGIGELLMEAAEARALADGKLEFACDTADRAGHLISLYLRRGFRVAGRHRWGHAGYESVVLSKRLGVRVRAAVAADLDAIVAISNTTKWEKGDFLRRMLAQDAIDVACVGDAVAGFNAWNREFFSQAMVWLVAVDPRYRGQGIGSQLYSSVERACRGSRLYSSTNRTNEGMHRFHERRGYRMCGELDLDPGDPEIFYCIDL